MPPKVCFIETQWVLNVVITTDDIERIEIVKGAQSTLYGSDASGGVINIITRRGKEGARTDALIEVGSYESFKTAVAFSGGSVQHDYRITASYYDTEGISGNFGIGDDAYNR